jgi:hypothetical protein
MFGIATSGGGMSNAMPDVCKTPAPPAPSPIPIPYPNIASLAQAKGTSTKVKISGSPTVTMGSDISMTSGDEGGVAGGVMSSKFKGPAKPKKGSTKVKAEGKAVIFQTCMFGQNGTNANSPAGVHGTPSQTKVTVTG